MIDKAFIVKKYSEKGYIVKSSVHKRNVLITYILVNMVKNW